MRYIPEVLVVAEVFKPVLKSEMLEMILAIGIYYAIMDIGKQKTSPEDYFLAGGKFELPPVMFSYIVTSQSSILYLGYPAEVYIYGTMYAFYGLSKFITLLLTAYFIVPIIHPLKVTSIYEYLNLRYGDNVLRILAMTFGAVNQVFDMSTSLF
ncbi:SC5A6-like protein [Mya arenaria]|uniref:SC5A6-like protein n=1 Tax=Mya arenaria TaxID=6604 RepID=A0ABY7G9N1_MYAAR|nr:SC5A6-like protein [Mya arenaria]